jgi:hypothetical protein
MVLFHILHSNELILSASVTCYAGKSRALRRSQEKGQHQRRASLMKPIKEVRVSILYLRNPELRQLHYLLCVSLRLGTARGQTRGAKRGALNAGQA